MIRFSSARQILFAVMALIVVGVGLPAFAARPVPFQGRADLVITGTQPLTASATGKATHSWPVHADGDDRCQSCEWRLHWNTGVHRSQRRSALRRCGGTSRQRQGTEPRARISSQVGLADSKSHRDRPRLRSNLIEWGSM